MGEDLYAPARRALLYSPPLVAVGGLLIFLGASGALSWPVIVPGGLLLLVFGLRGLAAVAALAHERRRQRLLRSGVQATGRVRSARQLSTQGAYAVYKIEIEVSVPSGESGVMKRTAAVPAAYSGELVPGAELPMRTDAAGPQAAVIDWNAL